MLTFDFKNILIYYAKHLVIYKVHCIGNVPVNIFPIKSHII